MSDSRLVLEDPDAGYSMRVYRYDIKGKLPDGVVAEIRRAHDLRNSMVAIELNHAERVAEIWASRPELAEAEAAIEEAAAILLEVRDELRESKKEHRTRKGDPVLVDRVRQAREAHRSRKVAHKEAKKAIYAEVKPLMIEAQEHREERLKALYPWARDNGLYWASVNAVRDDHENAVKAVSRRRKEGQPAQIRFHRWQGAGSISVQLQRQAGNPQRTPTLLSDPENSKWRNQVRLDNYPTDAEWESMSRRDIHRHARQGVTKLTFRIGSGKVGNPEDTAALITLSIRINRPIDPQADITGIKLTRRMIGGQEHASVSFVCRVPAIPLRIEGSIVVVHLGWRVMPDDSIRVASIAGAPMPPEELVAKGIVRKSGIWFDVVIPSSWRERVDHTAGLAAVRDKNHNIAKRDFINWLKSRENHALLLGMEDLTPQSVEKWRSPKHLAEWTERWRENRPPGMPVALVARLENWRRQDKHLWTWHANQTARLAGRRLDAYRKVARWITSEAVTVVVDGWSSAELTRKPDLDQEDTHQAEKARANRVLASPGILRLQMQRAAASVGASVTEPPPGTRLGHHWLCETDFAPDARRASHMVHCAHCDAMVDQDHNALSLLAAAAS